MCREEMFLEMNKHADPNKAVQGGFFLKINKRACTTIRYTRVLSFVHLVLNHSSAPLSAYSVVFPKYQKTE